MEFRQRASPEQFTLMLDFMERNGDLSRPQPGAQGRLRADHMWNELTELLNSVGGSGIQKPADKWKRVWSDWKTKTKKKASLVNRDAQGTGGGPSRARPLNPLEERLMRIIGLGSIIGHQEIQEAGFEVEVPIEPTVRTPTPQPAQALSPAAAEHQPLSATHGVPASTTRQEGAELDALRSPSAGPSTPRRRRISGQRRRRHQTSFEQAASEFARIEEGRVRLEEMRILKQHEIEMEQLRVESQRIAMEQHRNEILERIADTVNNVMVLLSRSRLTIE